jgi:hypothetical protein
MSVCVVYVRLCVYECVCVVFVRLCVYVHGYVYVCVCLALSCC